MPNDYFQFKQFTVRQERCAMKVTMDACIFGAWVPVPVGARRVLDIGTGTGLLALMLAQRVPEIEVDAVEIDEGAATQAAENISASPFGDRIRVFHSAIADFEPDRAIDFVVSNPPFFEAALAGPDDRRNLARHAGTLKPIHIFGIAKNRMDARYGAAVLTPPPLSEWAIMFESGEWSMDRILDLHPTAEKPIKRKAVAGIFNRIGHRQSEKLIVNNPDGCFTEEAKRLLQPFYLKL